jgi:hypothetical protein
VKLCWVGLIIIFFFARNRDAVSLLVHRGDYIENKLINHLFFKVKPNNHHNKKTSTTMSTSNDIETPLMGGDGATTTTTNNSSTVRCCRATVRSCWVVLAILFVIAIIVVVVLGFEGAWDPVSHEHAKRVNDSYIEPNTGVGFARKIVGPQELLGVSLWRYKIPLPGGLHVKIAAVGLYVNPGQARSRLRQFHHPKNNKDDDDDEKRDEALKEALTKPGMLQTMRFKMVESPPSGETMVKGWVRIFWSTLFNKYHHRVRACAQQ